jgi:uncharacterized membrane protein YgcG
MFPTTCRARPFFAALVWLLALLPASAATPEVKDAAGFFSADAVQKANALVQAIKKQSGKDVVIETFPSVPAERAADVKGMDRAARNRFFEDWAKQRMREAQGSDIYVLICRTPGHIQVGVGEETQKRAFPQSDRNKFRDQLVQGFQSREYDKALLDGLGFVRDRLEKNVSITDAAPVPNQVRDYAHFFSPDAVHQADGLLQQLHDRLKRNVIVETFPTLPPDRAKQIEGGGAEARTRAFEAWLRERGRAAQTDDVHVLICREPAHIQVGISAEAQKKAFTTADRGKLRDLLVARFRDKQYDQGLLRGLDLVYDTIDRNQSPPLSRPVVRAVKDHGGFFSASAVRSADETLQAIYKDTGREVVVETFPTAPPGHARQVEAMNPADRDRFFSAWVGDRQTAINVDGIFLLACRQPSRVEIGVGTETAKKGLPPADQDKLRGLLIEDFKGKRYDDGLAAGLRFLGDRLRDNLGVPKAAMPRAEALATPPAVIDKTKPAEPPSTTTKTSVVASAKEKAAELRDRASVAMKQEAAPGIKWSTIMWIIVAIIGLWILIGIIRGLSRARRPQTYGQVSAPPGYGPPPAQPSAGQGYPPQAHRPAAPAGYGPAQPSAPGYGPPVQGPPPGYGGGNYGGGGGGGGGGGFLSGMLGGMFGAAAGNWVYDSMFRRSGPSAGWGAGSARAGDAYRGDRSPASPAGGAAGAGSDYSAPMSSSGGDFGDDAGAGMATAGGDFDGGAAASADTGGGDFDAAPAQDAGGDFEGGADGGSDFADAGQDAGGGDFGGGGQDDAGSSDFGGDAGGGGGDSGGGGGDFGGDAGGGGGGGDFGGGGDSGGSGGGDF